MLKVVSTKKVRLGMFIQELKGAWIDHPFWKKAFKLEDPSDLKKLQASVIKEVVIDISKGLDEAEPGANIDSSPPEVVKIPPETKASSSASPKPIRITASEEHERAKQVITGSKKAVASMFHDVRMGKAINAESAMQLVDDIAASVDRNLGALISLVRLKNKDEYIYMHSVAVCALMVALAKELGFI